MIFFFLPFRVTEILCLSHQSLDERQDTHGQGAWKVGTSVEKNCRSCLDPGMDPLMTGARGDNMTTRAWGRRCVLCHKMKQCVQKEHGCSHQMTKEIYMNNKNMNVFCMAPLYKLITALI